jgi:hypothetical protein
MPVKLKESLVVRLPDDPPDLADPELAVVSDLFRKMWAKSGKSLAVLAREIDLKHDEFSGLNKDKLHRFLHSGYYRYNGLKLRDVFLPQARMIGEYFDCSTSHLKFLMASEKLRRFVIGELSKADKTPSDFVQALAEVLSQAEVNESIAWFEKRPNSLNLDVCAGAFANALNQLTKDQYTGANIREFFSEFKKP